MAILVYDLTNLGANHLSIKRIHNTYVPLHGHSSYSLNDGVSKITDMLARATELKLPALGLTEHGNMGSFYKFYNAFKGSNTKPIIGCEFYLNDSFYEDREGFLNSKKRVSAEADNTDEEDTNESDYSNSHILAYAKNYEGLNNIIHLSNTGFQNFHRKPMISTDNLFNMLDKNNIVTTACLGSQFNKMIMNRELKDAAYLLMKYKEKFGDDFYIELHVNNLPEQIIVNNFYKQVAPKLGIKLSLALDYHYVYKEDWEIQYLMYVIKGRKTVRSMPVEDWFYQLHDLYIKSIDEIYDKADELGFDSDMINEAIESNFEIADKTDIKIPKYQNKFPAFLDNYSDSEILFDEKLAAGWEQKLSNGLIPKDKEKTYRERLTYEVSVIKEKKFVDYFLILDDLLNNFVYASGGALGAGRGSACGSLVLFLLDITKLDPIRHELIFERFMNPAREDPPDVDCDIDSVTHKQVEQYLIERWGHDRVCHITSFGKYGTKTIIKDLCRVFELDYGLSNKLTALFSTTKTESDITEELNSAKEIARKAKDTQLVNFIDDNSDMFIRVGSKFLGAVRNQGRHASGILICNEDFDKSDLPISILKGDMVTGVQEGGDEREVSELGFLKLDILGLIAATINSHTMKLVENKYGIKNIENSILLSDFDDEGVYQEFDKGNCKDIFQFGSDSMISLIKRIKPRTIADLSAINALFRPALIAAGGIDEYCNNRENPKKAKKELDKIHPQLWNILEDACGIPLYQESIMFILQTVGGFTLAEADKARKTLKLLHKGNQDKTDDFLKMIEKFHTQAVSLGVTEDNVKILLDKLGAYTEYSFNKCLSGDTEVFMPLLRKNKQLKDFIGGESVISVDPKTKRKYVTKVKCLHKNGLKNLFAIQLAKDGYQIIGVKCTMDHKFMTESGQMKSLGEILKNDEQIVVMSFGAKHECLKFDKSSLTHLGVEETYDLEIDDNNHNFVLNNGIITSNSHSLSYACNAYISQYLKVHYPREYYSVLLNNSTPEDISTYMKQAILSGIGFGECCYGECADTFVVDYDNDMVKFGLSSTKGVRAQDVKELNEFETDDGKELVRFMVKNKINKKTIEILSRLGFFKKIIHKNYYFTEQLIFKLRSSKFQNFDEEYDEYIKYANKFEDYSQAKKFKFEKEYLGFYFNEHPFTQFFDKLQRANKANGYVRPKDLEEVDKESGPVMFLGLVSEKAMLKGKKSGKEYYKIVLEDDEQQINITIFDAMSANAINEGDIITITCDLSDFGITKNRKTKVRVIEATKSNASEKMKTFDEIVIQNATESWF